MASAEMCFQVHPLHKFVYVLAFIFTNVEYGVPN